MADTGRPTLLTEELQNLICDRIEKGTRPEVAAGREGIGRRTFYEWMTRGRNGELLYAAFRTAVARAEDVWEDNAGETAQKGDEPGTSFGPSKAALEALGRRRPRHWGQRVKHELDDGMRELVAIVERVCREKDRTDIFLDICEELACLDSEGDAVAVSSDAGVH